MPKSSQKKFKKALYTRVPKRILLSLLLIVIIFFTVTLESFKTVTAKAALLNTQTAEQESLLQAYANMNLEAQSVIVYDATNDKILFGMEPNASRPLASITKIMTALIAKTTLSDITPITITAADRTSSPDLDLRLGDTWNAYDLTQYSLVKSSNDGITAICSAVTAIVQKNDLSKNCLVLMNEYAASHDFTSLYFSSPNGLDQDDGSPTNMGSVYDVARLLNLAYNTYPALFAVTTQPLMTFHTAKYFYQAKNTDDDLGSIKNILAGKTGFTDDAGGNLAILYSPISGIHIAIVVLGSSQEGRFSDMLELVQRTNTFVDAYHY